LTENNNPPEARVVRTVSGADAKPALDMLADQQRMEAVQAAQSAANQHEQRQQAIMHHFPPQIQQAMQVQQTQRHNRKTITLPNGLAVVLGPPPMATQFLIDDIWGDKLTASKTMYTKALMWVRAVGSAPYDKPPDSQLALQELANMIGDDGMDMVFMEWGIMNKGFSPAAVQEAKKNL